MVVINGKNVYGINKYELKRKNGVSEIKYLVKYKNQIKRGFDNEIDAYIFLQNVHNGLISMRNTVDETPQNITTVKDAINIFIDYYEKTEVYYGTYHKVRYYLTEVVIPNINCNKDIKDFTNLDALNFRNKLNCQILKKARSKDEVPSLYSTRTKNDILQIFKEFLIFAVDNFDVDKKVTKKVSKFKKTKEDIDTSRQKEEGLWSLEEYYIFLDKVKELDGANSAFYGIFLFLGHKGVRLGEAFSLRYNDIKNGYIVIDESVTRKTRDHSYEYNRPKSENSYREIALGESFMEYLVERKKRDMMHLNFKDDWLVFHRENNPYLPIAETTFNNHRKRAIKEAGLNLNTNHQMRHMFNTAMKDGGMTAFDRGKVLGNDEEINNNVYTHISEETRNKVIEIENSMTKHSISNSEKKEI